MQHYKQFIILYVVDLSKSELWRVEACTWLLFTTNLNFILTWEWPRCKSTGALAPSCKLSWLEFSWKITWTQFSHSSFVVSCIPYQRSPDTKNTYSIFNSPLVQLILVRIKLGVPIFLGTTLDELEFHNSGWNLLLGLVLWICLLIIALEEMTSRKMSSLLRHLSTQI